MSTHPMKRGTPEQLMTRSVLAVEREQLERAIACAPTRHAEHRLGARWADVTFRLELEERELLAHHPVSRAGSGVTPPADFTLATRLTASPRRTTNHSPR